MIRVLIEGENILAKAPCNDKVSFKGIFESYFPRNSSGEFSVSTEGKVFQDVKITDFWDYPYVHVNHHVEGDAFCHGISENGISMIAFEKKVSDVEANDISLKYPPSFITIFENNIQFVFVLYNFMPKEMSEKSMSFFEHIIAYLEDALYSKYTDRVLNPCVPKVESWISTHLFKSRFRLNDLNCIAEVGDLRSAEKAINYIAHGKAIRAKGGRAAAAVTKSKSIDIINATIADMKSKGLPINQTTVAELSGKSRKTVNKNWKECIV